jgi:hypothetical protein
VGLSTLERELSRIQENLRLAACGPARKVLHREVVQRKWQLVTLDCTHRILMPKYQKSAKVRCGLCGGLEPLSSP